MGVYLCPPCAHGPVVVFLRCRVFKKSETAGQEWEREAGGSQQTGAGQRSSGTQGHKKEKDKRGYKTTAQQEITRGPSSSWRFRG